ncbi:MAG: 16S rRNA (uracil(1498)-N(3))-methyltransferase [Acidobacteria bacterium]|nr:16S rRNA (uracil(1498)-N(3))-methyltransferase [Acidobacteriota bacterium]
MHARFYGPDAERIDEVVELPSYEAEHLVRVLRLKPGAHVRVFNGRGAEFAGAVETVGRHGVRVRLHGSLDAQAEISVAVTLAQAVLKGDKMDDVIRDAVMMGVAVIQPTITTRTEASVASLRRGHRQERWQRIAVSAAKQSGRAVVPDVREPCAFKEAVESLDAGRRGLMFVEPSAGGGVVSPGELAKPSNAATMLVGPEGGWTPEEISQGSTCCQLVTLGARTLRADSVALVAFAALLTLWKEL